MQLERKSVVCIRSRMPQLRVMAVAAPLPSHGRNIVPRKEFKDTQGRSIKPMPADYGFRTGGGRLYEEHYGEVPTNVWQLAKDNFQQEWDAMRRSFRYNSYYNDYIVSNPPKTMLQKFNVAVGGAISGGLGRVDAGLEAVGALPKLEPLPPLTEEQSMEFNEIQSKLNRLSLSNEGVMRREEQRIAATGDFETPTVVKFPFVALCWLLDVVYDNRPIQKFWVLETVARIPYFAYISCLHLYESLGFWRAGAELRKIHFAEEWNEMHHLQIMESLGGDQAWFDRFLADHAAILYYWLLIAFYLASPKVAYNFMQRVELHAADTYTEFLEANRQLLATIPAPKVAMHYYRNEDLYLFDEFQTGAKDGVVRRPECATLLDVFTNIRDDELEHVKTMEACQNETIAAHISNNVAKRGNNNENQQ